MEDYNVIVLPKEKEKTSSKEKLRNWYIKNVANNTNTISKMNDIKTTVDNTVGAIALIYFVPALSILVPAIQKGYKSLRKFVYNKGREIIHDKLDIKDSDLNIKDSSKLLDTFSEEEIEDITKTTGEIVMKRKAGK